MSDHQDQDQDQEQTHNCGFCQESLSDGSTCNLECNHRFHFRCVLIDVAAKHQVDQRSMCPTCNENIISPEVRLMIFEKADELYGHVDERTQTTQVNIIEHLLESSEHFREDLTALKEKRRIMNKCDKEFKTKMNTIHTAYKNQIKDLLLILKGSNKEAKNTLYKSDEYKRLVSSSRIYSNSYDRIATKYNVCRRHLYSTLFRTRRRYRRSFLRDTRWSILYKFRIRIT